MAAKRKVGSRSRWLSWPGVIEWIVHRQPQAVQRAEETPAAIANDEELAKREKPTNWGLLGAIRAVNPSRWRTRKLNNPAKVAAAYAEAEDELAALEKDGRLVADANGLYSSAAVKKLFPSKAGHGLGQQKKPYADIEKITRLGMHLLLTAPARPVKSGRMRQEGKRVQLQRPRKWCRDRGLITRDDQFPDLRRKALIWARRELATRKRFGVGIARTKFDGEPIVLAEQEYADARANLAAWKKLTPPRPKR